MVADFPDFNIDFALSLASAGQPLNSMSLLFRHIAAAVDSRHPLTLSAISLMQHYPTPVAQPRQHGEGWR